MSQEKKMEPRLGPLDVVLYAAVLCVHYPLRIAFAIYRLAKAAIVKIVSLPRQCLGYILEFIFTAEGTLEKKLISILNLLATLPSYVFGKTVGSITKKKSGVGNDIKTDSKTITDDSSALRVIWTTTKQTAHHLLISFLNVLQQILLIPAKILFFPVKLGRTALETMSNAVKSSKQPQKEKKGKKPDSLFERALDFAVLLIGVIQHYLKQLMDVVEKTVLQISALILNIPRHLLDLIKTIFTRCAQAVVLYFIFIYNLGRFSLFYAIYLINRIFKGGEIKVVSNSEKASSNDAERLIKENSKLKAALADAQQKNATHKCDHQIKDLQKQLNEVQSDFDKERQEYKLEIEKLKRDRSQNHNETINDFSSERGKLQNEIKKLQGLIAEVQKENAEENRIKKQEAIDLDNERNQLQEQIQKLQHQVIVLKKQTEANASRYEEYTEQMKIKFDKERQNLQNEIQRLQQQIAENEQKQNFDGNCSEVVEDDQTKSTEEASIMKNNMNAVGKNGNKKKRTTPIY